MVTDFDKYHKLYVEYLKQINRLQDEMDPVINDILSDVCSFLRVAKLQTVFFETVHDERSNNGHVLPLYSNDNGEEYVLTIKQRYVTDAGNVVYYEAYNYANARDWSEWEHDEIDLILETIYSIHGRIRTSKVASRLTFYNNDLDIPNIRYFSKYMVRKLEQRALIGNIVCVFNIRRLSLINDLVGREVGTKVMVNYAKGFEQCIGENGCLCHLGGDNFVSVFPKNRLDVAREYLKGTRVPYGEGDHDAVVVSSAIGLYVIEKDIPTFNIAIDGAHSAMMIAKGSDYADEIFWNDEMQETLSNHKQIENMFLPALRNEEFKVYYQPKMSLMGDYHIAGAEALCRWMHDGRLIYPNDFIPVLERSSNICKLDFYVLDQVCRDIRQWIDDGLKAVKVSVNFSRKHLGDPDLLTHIVEIIDRYNIPHELIEIELTETTTDVDFKDLKRIAKGLHECGIHTSVDDFGMGYSSLNLIRDIQWNVLKIDKSFLPDPKETDADNKKKEIMLRHVIGMAQELGLECIVEGVETMDHVDLLLNNNCFLAQGFYFDRPLPHDEFETRLELI